MLAWALTFTEKCVCWPLNKKLSTVALQEEDNLVGFHGVAYVNFSPLLYPGGNFSIFSFLTSDFSSLFLILTSVKRLRGAFKVFPYIESDFGEKVRNWE